MSPYFFILRIKGLSYLIEKQVDEGGWKPVWVLRGGTIISHLLFADNVLFFGKASAG